MGFFQREKPLVLFHTDFCIRIEKEITMLQHIFKLIWKKRKSNFLMMLEIFVSFLILFAVWSLSVYTYRNYATPAGLSTERVWAVFLDYNTDPDSVRQINNDLVARHLQSIHEIEGFTFAANNLPFSFSSSNRELNFKGKKALSEVMFVSASYPEVMGMSVSAGKWFSAADTVGGKRPIVITRHLARELLGTEEPIGQPLGLDDNDTRTVVGVVDYFRFKSSFQADENCFFEPAGRSDNNLLLKVGTGANAEFEARLARSLQQLNPSWTIEIQHLDQMKSTQNQLVLIPILILFAICGFLVFNVGLGLFGVLFQNISRRKGEIGIRRAVGATKAQIMAYFMGETLVIAVFGIALGIFFAIQIPLLHVLDVESSIYVWGIVLAVLSICCITLLCAFYPSRQAAAIYPAAALHEE